MRSGWHPSDSGSAIGERCLQLIFPFVLSRWLGDVLERDDAFYLLSGIDRGLSPVDECPDIRRGPGRRHCRRSDKEGSGGGSIFEHGGGNHG